MAKYKSKQEINKERANELMRNLAMNSATLSRSVLDRILNPNRDVDVACKYPITISTADYKAMFEREGVGKRVVSILPEETWSVEPDIYEVEDSGLTDFEQAYNKLITDHNLLYHLCQADVLSGIGRFGLLIIGINDGKDLSEPVSGINPSTGEVTGTNSYELLYLRQVDESAINISQVETDLYSPRYGLPTKYTVQFQSQTVEDVYVSKDIHWTRVVHLADNRINSNVYGVPRMKPVWNRLLDIKKVLGGSAEMFWAGGFPGYSFEVSPDVADAEIDKEAVKEEFERWSNGLQRWLALTGITAKSLSPQVADPTAHIEMQMKNISFTLGIPYRIFLGTEEAQLASSQDIKTWLRRVSRRQNSYATPMIIRPVIDRLIVLGILPQVESYKVVWPDYSFPTVREKIEIADIETKAMATYISGGVDALIPPKQFFIDVLGYTSEKADALLKETIDEFESTEEVPADEQTEEVNSDSVKEEIDGKE